MLDPVALKHQYDRIANRLIEEGILGSGLHEDLLISSSKWFNHRIGTNGHCLADFFATALENNVALLFALPSEVANSDTIYDLFEFLHRVTACVCQLPHALLRKIPEPLVLIVGHRGFSDQYGAQIMRQSGPSIIFWQTFSSIRKAIGELSYDRLNDQIVKTIVHELIGHQMAFCSPTGPLVTRHNVREILEIAGINVIKLNTGASLSISDFLSTPDLLAAVRRTEYIQSSRHPERYFANVMELIAVAVQGASDYSPYNYTAIRHILKSSLLREIQPVVKIFDKTPVFRSYDVSIIPFTCSYMYQDGDTWHETDTLYNNGNLLCRFACDRAYKVAHNESGQVNQQTMLQPGQSIDIRLPFDAIKVTIEGTSFMMSPLGLSGLRNNDVNADQNIWRIGKYEINWCAKDEENGILRILNISNCQLPLSFQKLYAVAPILSSCSN